MVVLSVLPIGLLQTVASVNEGMWYARSAEFMQQPGMDTLRWLRVIGDTIFAIGLVSFVWFVFSLDSKKKLAPVQEEAPEEEKVLEEVE